MFVEGFIFYNSVYEDNLSVTPEPLTKLSKLLTHMYPGDKGKVDLNEHSYNITKDAIHFSSTDNYFSSSGRDHYYDFCVVDGTPCSIITIYTDGNRRHGVSEDYYQIVHGHCNDTVTVSAEAQEKLMVPPTPLTENYLECRRTIFSALFASGGIAVGNVLSVKSGLVLLFSVWLARYTNKSTKKDCATDARENKKTDMQFTTYGMVERDKVLQYLAFNLLLARDNKYDGDTNALAEFSSSNSSLVKDLAEELKIHPNLKRFFPANGAEVVDSDHVNPLQQHNTDGIELTGGGASLDAGSGSNSRHKNKLCSNLSTSISRKNQTAFEEELLLNPMYVKETQ